MEIRTIKELATIQTIEINDALKRDNDKRKRLAARVVFTYDGDSGEKGETDDMQAFLNSGASGSTYSIIIDLNRMKVPADVTDRLAYVREKLEGKRLKFSTFVATTQEIAKGRKYEELARLNDFIVTDGKSEMASQSVSFPDWNTSKEYAEQAIVRRFAQRLKSKKLRWGHIEGTKNVDTEETALTAAATDDDENLYD